VPDVEKELLFDPICGMWLEPCQVASTYIYLRVTYVFCCCECRDLFAQAPEVYVVQLAHDPRGSAGYLCPHQC
jgi:YHS domain-containing protein